MKKTNEADLVKAYLKAHDLFDKIDQSRMKEQILYKRAKCHIYPIFAILALALMVEWTSYPVVEQIYRNYFGSEIEGVGQSNQKAQLVRDNGISLRLIDAFMDENTCYYLIVDEDRYLPADTQFVSESQFIFTYDVTPAERHARYFLLETSYFPELDPSEVTISRIVGNRKQIMFNKKIELTEIQSEVTEKGFAQAHFFDYLKEDRKLTADPQFSLSNFGKVDDRLQIQAKSTTPLLQKDFSHNLALYTQDDQLVTPTDQITFQKPFGAGLTDDEYYTEYFYELPKEAQYPLTLMGEATTFDFDENGNWHFSDINTPQLTHRSFEGSHGVSHLSLSPITLRFTVASDDLIEDSLAKEAQMLEIIAVLKNGDKKLLYTGNAKEVLSLAGTQQIQRIQYVDPENIQDLLIEWR